MNPNDRLSEDLDVPEALRDALRRAATEKASPKLLRRVLASAELGGAALVATKGAQSASTGAAGLFGGSLVTKSAVALAIFAAGTFAGAYAMHRSDVRNAAVTIASPSSMSRAPIPAPAAAPQVAVDSPATTAAAASAVARDEADGTAHALSTEVEAARVATAPAPARRPMRAMDRPSRPATAPASTALLVPATASTGAAWEAPAARAAVASARDQLASLRDIQDAVESGRGPEALAAIEAHRARFPASIFDQEILVLEAQATRSQDAGVCAVLDRFRERYPNSLLLPRIEAMGSEAGCAKAAR
ncbi:MAG TPA: hypothetical protein VGM06_04130 [Polyangiaceae bacterium]